jgi:hypothetical protein
MLPWHRALASLLLCVSAHAGIVIVRSGHGLQFVDAVSVAIDGKDKALGLGSQPDMGGAAAKLPTVRLGWTLLKDSNAGGLLQYEGGNAEYLLPEGLPKNAPGDLAGRWKAARIVYKQSASDKAGTEVSISSFVAFLPAGVEDLNALCTDARALEWIGGTGKSFSTQIELMSAVVKAYPANPALGPLEKYVAEAMRSRYETFENGAGGVDVLNQGLEFAALSQAVYPKSPEQDKLRQLLLARKAWLDRRLAVQKAFTAAAQWDAFLLGGRDLEPFERAFPEFAADRRQALEASLQWHVKLATTLAREDDYGAAYREFRLAGARRPSDAGLREQAMQAWTEYSRRNAMEMQAKRGRLGAGAQSAVERDLYFADQNKLARKLDDALKNIQDAEAVLRASLPASTVSDTTLKVWYAEADILAAQDRTSQALAVLDTYDLYAVDEERAPAEALRNRLLFNLNTALKNLRARIPAAWSEGSFHLARQLAEQGLTMSGDDADLLYGAGTAALIERDIKPARDLLAHYLEVSDNLDANPEQRALAGRLLRLSASAIAGDAAAGDPNWLSGEKLPKGVFYSPISLAFQPRIDQVEIANKFHVAFEWNGERLKTIAPGFESTAHSIGDRKISFGYEDRVPQVVWATDGDDARPALSADPDEAYKHASVLPLNSPFVDPIAIQRITGKNLALAIAGNPFFNPFMWEKLCYFRISYDDRGRIVRAQQLSGPRGAAAEQVLEFDWNGMQLAAIHGFVGKTGNYERTMQYQDGRLVSEEIQGQGKPSHIKYNYVGDRLVWAEVAADPNLDNRNRKVTFLGNSPSTLVK